MSNAALSLLDQAVQAATPLLAQPHNGALPPLQEGSKRIVATSSGLQIQARTKVLDLAVQITNISLPYGHAAPHIVLPAGPVPKPLMKQFIISAQEAGEREIAAAVVLGTDGYELHRPKVLSSSGGHVKYEDSDINDDRLLIDLHSHGKHPAVFSSQDNASDMSRRGPYIAIVVGRCDTDQPEMSARLVLPPYIIPIPMPTIQQLGIFG